LKERIDHSNYEAWLLDRIEGKLTADEERELATFLLIHPELDPGVEELPSIASMQQRMDALDREALKRELPPTAAVDAHNVNDHLVARLESDLTSAQRDALAAYLVLHPEHQRAERLFALTKLVPEAMAFAHKQATYRALPPLGMPSRHTLDDFLVARLEGDLTADQDTALSNYLASEAAAARSWALMQAARIPAEPIVFADKASLKKGGLVIAIGFSRTMVRLAAAASVALLLGMAWWALTRTEIPGEQVAEEVKSLSEDGPSTSNEDARPVAVDTARGSVRDGVKPGAGGREERTPGRENRFQHEEKPELVPDQQVPQSPMAHEPKVPLQQLPESPEPYVPVAVPDEEPALAQSAPQAGKPVPTLGQALTGAVREDVLGQPRHEERPLDGTDAVAAVDAGLKAVAGERAGLSVERDSDGRRKRFDLRLGRNLAISASR
jgi:hypothetical protein